MMIAVSSFVYTLIGPSPTKWVLGLNKYSHDAGACLILSLIHISEPTRPY